MQYTRTGVTEVYPTLAVHNKYMQHTRTGVTEVYPTLATTNTCSSTPGQELHQDRSYTRTGVTEVYPTPATTNTCSTPGQELQKYILL